MTVFGDSSSATSGSFTISRILVRTNSAAVSFALLVEEQVDERAEERQPALLPPLLVHALALLGIDRERRDLPAPAEPRADRGRHQAVAGAEGGVVGLDRVLLGLVERRVVTAGTE